MIESHTAGPLYDWLEYHSGQSVGVLVDESLHRDEVGGIPFIIEAALGGIGEISFWKRRAEGPVHAGDRVAYRHGIPSVAMIPAADCGEICAAWIIVGLDGHFHCHFSGHRSGIGIEYVLHRRRKNLKQQASELNSRRVGEATEHDVRHLFALLSGRLHEHRMGISMNHAPPR